MAVRDDTDPAVAKFKARRAQQRATALELANAAKAARTAVRRGLRDGSIDPWELLAGMLVDHEPALERWPVEPLLRAIPGIGRVRAMDILVAFGASPATEMSAFSRARRERLALVARGALDITAL